MPDKEFAQASYSSTILARQLAGASSSRSPVRWVDGPCRPGSAIQRPIALAPAHQRVGTPFRLTRDFARFQPVPGFAFHRSGSSIRWENTALAQLLATLARAKSPKWKRSKRESERERRSRARSKSQPPHFTSFLFSRPQTAPAGQSSQCDHSSPLSLSNV